MKFPGMAAAERVATKEARAVIKSRAAKSRIGRAAGWATKTRGRRITSGVVAGGMGLNAMAMYSRTPGPNRSSRNQNSLFLRQMRRNGSSATMGLPGSSMGGWTG